MRVKWVRLDEDLVFDMVVHTSNIACFRVYFSTLQRLLLDFFHLYACRLAKSVSETIFSPLVDDI
jgi:hypothetical protein